MIQNIIRSLVKSCEACQIPHVHIRQFGIVLDPLVNELTNPVAQAVERVVGMVPQQDTNTGVVIGAVGDETLQLSRRRSIEIKEPEISR